MVYAQDLKSCAFGIRVRVPSRAPYMDDSMILLSEFYSEDKQKAAFLYDNRKSPFVDFLVNGKVIGCRSYVGKTFRYAEDAAENFVEGIMRVEDVLDTSRED